MATNKVQTGFRFEPELPYKITYVARENLNARLEYLAQVCVRAYEAENGSIPGDEKKLYRKKSSGSSLSRLFF